MKVAFHTLGCKVNQYETEALREQFIDRGFVVVPEDTYSDVYVINTCSVTNLADRKSRQYIRRMKKVNPESIIAVTGCYAQLKPEEVGEIEGVNIICGTNEKHHLLKYVLEFMEQKHRHAAFYRRPYEDLTEYVETGIVRSMESRTRAYIKVQEGCDRFCSYCVIPYARGAVRSRDPASIMEEAAALVEAGFKEIILTGINTALYGMEKGFSGDHASALKNLEVGEDEKGIRILLSLLDKMEGDFRVRLSSLEPTVINSDYVKQLLSYRRLCHHLHLSLQSGSNEILKAMNRRYDMAEYKRILEVLRRFDRNYGITTDIIVGFPGETEAQFKETVDFIQSEAFCKVHVFKYSKREETKASAMLNQVSGLVKNQRSRILSEIAEESALRFYQNNIGTNRVVLFEEYNAKSRINTGYTDNYIRVYVESDINLENTFRSVRMTAPFLDGMRGECL